MFGRALVGLVCMLGAAATQASDPVLVQGAAGSVHGSDVQAELQRMGPEARKSLLARPDSVGQMAHNLYMRRALAAQAQQQGQDEDPLVAAALRQAHDRVLADNYLAQLEAAGLPSAQALEAQASSTYKANPKRFTVPDQVRARHILVAKGPDAQAKAEGLLAQLQAGADFAGLAKAHSADSASAAKGGDLGYFARGQMVPSFEAAVFGLQQPGDRSALVETDFGFHIIELLAKRPAGVQPFEEVREGMVREIATKQAAALRLQAQNKALATGQLDKAAVNAFVAGQR